MHLLSITKVKLSSMYSSLISGFPIASGQLFLTIKLLFMNTLISLVLGKSGLTAFGVCYNCLFIIYIFLIGTAQSMSPIVSIFGVRNPTDIVVRTNAIRIFSLSIIGTGLTFLMLFYNRQYSIKTFIFSFQLQRAF